MSKLLNNCSNCKHAGRLDWTPPTCKLGHQVTFVVGIPYRRKTDGGSMFAPGRIADCEDWAPVEVLP